MPKYLLLFLLTAALSLLFTPVVRLLARRFGVLDHPEERKIHGKPIPRLGGFSIFIAFNAVLLASHQIDFFYFPLSFIKDFKYGWFFVASLIVLGLGAVDDFRRISPKFKLLFQIIAGLIVALTCYKIEVIASPFGTIRFGIWAIPVTVLWVVAITNAINLLDGLDGLAAGTSLIVCIAMFAISLLNENIGIALTSIILAGSILGFLKYNFSPASIFLGDSGAYYLGFMLSALSLLSNMKGTTALAILVPIIALGLPIMDTLLSMLRRLLQSLHISRDDKEKNMVKFLFSKGKSMVKPDKDHIHHRLLKLGFSQRNAVLTLYVVTFILGAIALSAVYFRNIDQALLITAIALASYIGVRKLGYSEIQFLRDGTLVPLFESSVVSQRLFRVFADVSFIALSYYLALLFRFEGDFSPAVREHYLSTIPLILFVKMVVFYLAGLYKGSWGYMNVDDVLRMLRSVLLGCVVAGLILWFIPSLGVISRTALFIDFNLLFFFVIATRTSSRVQEYLSLLRNRQGKSVLIYGLGRAGSHALNEFLSNRRLNLKPVGFIDDDESKKGEEINGYPVLGTLENLEGVLGSQVISEVIVSRDDIPEEKLDRLSQICSSHQIFLRRLKTSLVEVPTPRP
jgi:UDP-GlcNAc:undecaprenyl-phosphate GlcNAc-1-phosphate transferase